MARIACLLLCLSAPQGHEPSEAQELREGLQRAVHALMGMQSESGRFGLRAPDSVFELGFAPQSFPAWQMASQALATLALASVEQTSECEKALRCAIWRLCCDPIPTRGSDWDTDNLWAELYGFVACVQLLRSPQRFGSDLQEALDRRGREFLARLKAHEALGGGWAYYDDPPYGARPTWATSFCTALVLPSLVEAKDVLGWPVGAAQIARAKRFLERCAMPGGAFAYDQSPVARIAAVEHINLPEGSLSRTQVCNWALATLGDPRRDAEVLRAGLSGFFRSHGFLDHVRTRPIPHEGFHANAGYFYYFGHYYAALVIELLPPAERASWHKQLRPHLLKTFRRDGLVSDFLDASYLVAASTSYAILALAAGQDDF